jgi:hypothetical protein
LASINSGEQNVQGTPQEIVSAILLGSGFSCGTVEPTGTLTFATNGRTSSRAMILNFCQENGYEAEFRGYFVFIYNLRGATIPKELVDRNVVAISKTVDKAKGTRSFPAPCVLLRISTSAMKSTLLSAALALTSMLG